MTWTSSTHNLPGEFSVFVDGSESLIKATQFYETDDLVLKSLLLSGCLLQNCEKTKISHSIS